MNAILSRPYATLTLRSLNNALLGLLRLSIHVQVVRTYISSLESPHLCVFD